MASNPYVSKVIYGNNTVMDLTGDTVAPNNLLAGYTAHDKSGAPIVGEASMELDGDATNADVLSGKTFYNNSIIKQTGGMTNNNAVSPSPLNCGGSYTIPEGYHNGQGVVTANSLANQTGVDNGQSPIDANHVVSGYQGWVNGTKITGNMTNNGAVSQTLNTSTTSYTIPEGYHNGSGKVSITTQSKSTTPSAGGSAYTVTPDSGKVLSSVTINAVRYPLVIGGREVSRIYVSDTKTYTSSDDCANVSTLGSYVLSYKTSTTTYTYVNAFLHWTKSFNTGNAPETATISTLLGNFTFGVTVSSSKYALTATIGGTTTTLWSATASVVSYDVRVIRLNTQLYLILYTRSIDSSYGKRDNTYSRFVYLDASGNPVLSGSSNLGCAQTQTATTTLRNELYLASVSDDNSHIIAIRQYDTSSDSTGDYTAHSAAFNYLRYRGISTVGLRSTSWTSIFNNKAYYWGRIISQGAGFYSNYYNSSGSVDTYAVYALHDADTYGTAVNDYATNGTLDISLSPRECYGQVGDYFVALSAGGSSSSYSANSFTLKYKIWTYDKGNRKRLRCTSTSSTTFTISQAMLNGVTSYSISSMYLAFFRIIKGVFVIGIRYGSALDNTTGTSFSSTYYAVGFSVKINNSLVPSFTYCGVSPASTFRTNDLKDSLANRSTSCDSFLLDWLDARYTTYDYDYFRQYVVKYKE